MQNENDGFIGYSRKHIGKKTELQWGEKLIKIKALMLKT